MAPRMGLDEQIVGDYLNSLFPDDVVHEPNGNVPPDFVISGKIAVEARRLNQHYVAGGRVRGLETDYFPLQQSFEKLLADFGPAREDKAWFVSFCFNRPIPKWKKLKPLVRTALECFLQQPSDEMCGAAISAEFEITFIPSSIVEDQVFLFGSSTDLDAGGWVVSEIVRNLSAYVVEKTRKIQPFRSKYSSWWLIFVDHIGHGRNAAEVQRHFERPADWNRVLVLSPDRERVYEI